MAWYGRMVQLTHSTSTYILEILGEKEGKFPSHNVSGRLEQATQSLAALATLYLMTEAAGRSQATLDAKRRDLQRFLVFYQGLYKHDRPDVWFVGDEGVPEGAVP